MYYSWTFITGALTICCYTLLLPVAYFTETSAAETAKTAFLITCVWALALQCAAFSADNNDHLKLNHDNYITRCKTYVYQFVTTHKFDTAHDYNHCLRVHSIALEALQWSPDAPPWVRLAVELGALLHEVDDRKCAPPSRGHLPQARRILDKLFLSEEDRFQRVIDAVLESIDLTSASKNGNRFPSKCAHPLLLVVRLADRLTAVGGEGIRRCLQYTLSHGQPISVLSTPTPSTLEQFRKKSAHRFGIYQKNGKSLSAVDHIYDKLSHLSNFEIPKKYQLPPVMFLMGRLREADSEVTDFALAFHDSAKFASLLKKHVSAFHDPADCSDDCPTCAAVRAYEA